MSEKAKSLVEMMKERIAKTGKGQKNLFYVKKDGRVRVRFLNDLEEGVVVAFHSKWKSHNHPCLKYYGKECPNCDNDESYTADNFVFTVWNYETKQKELFIYKANKCTPIPALVTMFETYDTICDRDYVISRQGEGTDTVYTVVPMDRKKFKGDEEPYTKKEVLKMLLKAFPPESEDEDDEDEDYVPKKNASKKSASKKYDDYDEDDYDDDEDEDEDDYEYKSKRKSKKPNKDVVIGSSAKKNFDDDDDDFDEDDEIDYNEMTNAELKAECKKRKFSTKGMNREQVIQMLEDNIPF